MFNLYAKVEKNITANRVFPKNVAIAYNYHGISSCVLDFLNVCLPFSDILCTFADVFSILTI